MICKIQMRNLDLQKYVLRLTLKIILNNNRIFQDSNPEYNQNLKSEFYDNNIYNHIPIYLWRMFHMKQSC